MYGAVFQPSLDAAFRAAEAHGIRAVIGKVMMDRGSYDDTLSSARVLDASLRQSADLCARWHMRDDGRLRYAFTPRFALSCGPDMLRRSADARPRDRRLLADARGGGPQRDPRGRAAVPRRRSTTSTSTTRPAASGRGRSSPTRSTSRRGDRPRRRDRLARSPTAPPRTCSSPRARCRSPATWRPGSGSGLGSDVAPGRSSRSSPTCAPAAYIQSGLRVLAEERGEPGDDTAPLQPLDWLRSRPTRARGRSGSRTRSGRSRPARRPT